MNRNASVRSAAGRAARRSLPLIVITVASWSCGNVAPLDAELQPPARPNEVLAPPEQAVGAPQPSATQAPHAAQSASAAPAAAAPAIQPGLQPAAAHAGAAAPPMIDFGFGGPIDPRGPAIPGLPEGHPGEVPAIITQAMRALGMMPPLPSPYFATVDLEDGTSLPQIGHGDLWPSCWSDDDALYTAAGDGRGFGAITRDVAVAVIEGRPGEAGYHGTQLAAAGTVSDVWSGSDYNRKPTGILCLQGDLYLAVQDLRKETFADAPAATIVRSRDKGRTWTWDRSAPMFSKSVWTTIMFLDYGKDSEHAPSDFVYAYGLDDNWAFSDLGPGPTSLFLARIPRDQIQTRAAWEFFAGFAPDGQPLFSPEISERAPVLEDTRRLHASPLDPKLRFQNMTVINQGGVVYNAPLDRYLFSTWTEYTFELYEAPNPWGPFRLFYSKDFGVWPWDDHRNGGYATTIPSKFISEDGKHMLLQANSWSDVTGKDNYSFSLRALHVEPYRFSLPDNLPSPANLATPEQGAVRVVRAARNARAQVMNDGVTQPLDEDSHNGEAKQADYWGYTWPKALRINTLRYTTGKQAPEGGYFERLGIQARRGDEWVDVDAFGTEPAYPGGSDTAAFTTYTLRFNELATDGIRIHGRPGGSEHYTSIAELSVHLE